MISQGVFFILFMMTFRLGIFILYEKSLVYNLISLILSILSKCVLVSSNDGINLNIRRTKCNPPLR